MGSIGGRCAAVRMCAQAVRACRVSSACIALRACCAETQTCCVEFLCAYHEVSSQNSRKFLLSQCETTSVSREIKSETPK
jgi:hypothetical protein